MARMTNKQIDYALERLEIIYRGLCHKLNKPEEPVMPKGDELIQQLAKGQERVEEAEVTRAAVQAITQGHTDYYANDGKNFVKQLVLIVYGDRHDTDMNIYEEKKIIYDSRERKIREEMVHVKDQIMLGDVEEALRLLKKFAEFK